MMNFDYMSRDDCIDALNKLSDEIDALSAELASVTAENESRREMGADFHQWARSYLDVSRWAGHDHRDAVRQELIERDAQLARVTAEKDAALADCRVLAALGSTFERATRNGDLLYADRLTLELTDALDAARATIARYAKETT